MKKHPEDRHARFEDQIDLASLHRDGSPGMGDATYDVDRCIRATSLITRIRQDDPERGALVIRLMRGNGGRTRWAYLTARSILEVYRTRPAHD